MKIVFMGTPEFSVPILETLIKNYDVIGVVTQPDKKVGRKQILTPSPVKELALKHKIKVFEPLKISTDYESIINLNSDIIITAAYGQFIPNELIKAPKFGAINIHASLLPKLRGGSPIQTAIKDGLEETGITIIDMVSRMDAGDILSQEKISIEETDTYGSLDDKLSQLGKEMIIKVISQIEKGEIVKRKQEESSATFAYNIKREEEKLDFNKTSKEVYNHIRAYNPNPGAYIVLDNQIIKIWKAKIVEEYGTPKEIINKTKEGFTIATKDSAILIEELQPQGKKKMNARDYLNGKTNEKLIGKKVE